MPCSTHPKQLPSRRRFQRLSLSLNISKTTIASDSIGCQIMACQCQSVSSSCQLKTSREKKKDFQRSLDNSSKLPVSLSLDARWGMHIQLSHRSPCRSSRAPWHTLPFRCRLLPVHMTRLRLLCTQAIERAITIMTSKTGSTREIRLN
jgi:hypothetical protein